MAARAITPPYTVFNAADGTPLEAGYVYIGTAGLNPEVNPINVYLDATLTIPVAQPIRTLGGYPSANGTPAQLYVDFVNYSITIRDKNGALVVTAQNAAEILTAGNITNVPSGSIVATDVQSAIDGFDIHTMDAKVTPVDADESSIWDSVDGLLKKLTWANLKATVKAALEATGMTFTGPVLFNTVADIASATSIDLTAYGSGAIATVTGTTATSAFTMSDGQKVTLKAAAAWPLTYHATTNKVNSGGDALLAAGDLVRVEKTGGVVTSEVVKASHSCVRLNTANGYGSSGNKIRRFTNVTQNAGSDITYADSATLGASLTINSDGIYAVSYFDNFSAAATVGASVNASNLTTEVYSLAEAEILAAATASAANYYGNVSCTLRLAAGDVVRPHTDGVSTGTAVAGFTITRVA